MEKVILENVREGTILISSENIENKSDVDLIKNKDGIYLNIKDNYKRQFKIIYNLDKEINENLKIVIGKNCELTIIEEKIKGDNNYNGTVEIIVGENSKVNYIEIQNFNDKILNNIDKKISCGRGSYFSRQLICLGSKSTKYNINIYLDEASKVEDVELFFGDKEQKFELNTNLVHNKINSSGNVIVRGVLKDKAYCNSHGILKINKEAQNTSTFLAEHVLLLSKEAKAHAIPALEIEANNIQAHHSASVTQIDNDKIFYLISRGLDEQEAKKMIINGFLSSALEKTSNHVKEEWSKLFEEKWK